MFTEKEILERLADDTSWPSLSKPDLMAQLDGYAEEALGNASELKLIASILIYQQLVEEMLKITFETADFLTQVHLLPITKNTKPSKFRMFGQLVKEFSDIIEFPSKAEMIDLAKKINEKRIKVAHGLVHSYDLSAIHDDARIVNGWFFQFFSHFDTAQDWLNSVLYELQENRRED